MLGNYFPVRPHVKDWRLGFFLIESPGNAKDIRGIYFQAFTDPIVFICANVLMDKDIFLINLLHNLRVF